MATINTITFDQAAYSAGATITVAVNWTPDTAPVVPQTFTLTTNVQDAAGNILTTSTSPFVVNQAQPSGDTMTVSDDGGRTWTAGAVTVNTDGTTTSNFSATA